MSRKPLYLRDAIPTAIGWAHPLTGEQLTSTDGLANPVGFYAPNAESKSFIDPEGVVEGVIGAVVNGVNVDFALHSIKDIDEVIWDFGDGSNQVTGGKFVSHQYAATAALPFTVTADVTFSDNSTVQVTKSLQVGFYKPSAPRIVNIGIRPDSGSKVFVEYLPPYDSGDSAIVSYKVTAEATDTTLPMIPPNIFAPSVSLKRNLTLGAFVGGEEYTFEISATNAAGEGEVLTKIVTLGVGAPSAPTNIAATPGSTTIDVEWDAPLKDGGADIVGYEVTLFDELFETIIDKQNITSGTACQFTDLTPETNYFINITAYNSTNQTPVNGFILGAADFVPATTTAA